MVGIERLGGESVYHRNVAGHSIKALWWREDIASPNVGLAVDSRRWSSPATPDSKAILNTCKYVFLGRGASHRELTCGSGVTALGLARRPV